ncbi:MAG: putative glycosyltransferase [Parcubacteria group bacterium Athens1014_26]|nr:MAG: putative glycosyltransferase [Parcubacteria group bacterium Athens1014_26]
MSYRILKRIIAPGPIFVKLERISNGKKISVYKFRSMIDGAHQIKTTLAYLNERKDGPFFKIKNDPRLTRIGKIIRKFRLDEFPQFINVLKNELSLVGPRPHEPEEVAAFPENSQHIADAKAGVTGLSQVNGASGLPFLKELELDDYYIKNQSFGLDFKIFLKTLVILFTDPTGV